MNNKEDHSAQGWTADATHQLSQAKIGTAHLDAELILAHTLDRSRTWLHAHHDIRLSATILEIANARLQLRRNNVPIAYIIGHKEFYGRRFHITPATLVPRPESETILTLLKQLVIPTYRSLLDIGTGSGCLGITAKLEYPSLNVTLSDISEAALKVARKNARALHADVTTERSDLLKDLAGSFDIMLANLPYVDRAWDVSPDIAHEPELALYADEGGLALIKRLLHQATSRLNASGYLLLEADPSQHEAILRCAQKLGYVHVMTDDYIVVLSR